MAQNPHPLLLLFPLVFLLHRCQSQILDSNGFSLKLVRTDFYDIFTPPTQLSDRFPDTIRPPITRSSYLFTIDATIGTPSRKRTFIFDTGSSLIWTQCTPCIHCFKQDYPLFDPKQSSSFQKLSPNHALARFFKRSGKGDVTFKVNYESGQSSSGIAAVETFTFASNTNGRESIKGAVFGCMNNYKGVFSSNTMVTGILGMNRSPLSLVGQIGPKSVRRFSYCLPTLSSPIKSTFLRFGNDISLRGDFQKTSFITSGRDYSIKLLKISVAGRLLTLPGGTFSKGCILDVGSAASYLEKGAYTPVLNAVKQHLDRFNLTRARSNSSSEGDLCYRIKPGFRNLPSMTLHFQGANLEIGPENLFRVVGDRFCLALFSSRKLTMLGAYQQQNVRLVFDVGNDQLLFAKQDCSLDRAWIHLLSVLMTHSYNKKW